MSDEIKSELRLAEPNPSAPIQDMKMALCLNCGKPIIEIVGANVGWNHGHNGNPDCDAARPDDEAIENAKKIMAGEKLAVKDQADWAN